MWGEENSLEMYVRNSWDILLQGVRITGEIESEETVSKDELKTSWNNDLKLDSWKVKGYMVNFWEKYPKEHL